MTFRTMQNVRVPAGSVRCSTLVAVLLTVCAGHSAVAQSKEPPKAGAGAGLTAEKAAPPAGGAASAPASAPAEPPITKTLAEQAVALRSLPKSDLARAYLEAVRSLHEPSPRTVLRSEDRKHYYTAAQAASLPVEKRKELQEVTLPPSFYYNTRYGSPLTYVRAVDILAEAGLNDAKGRRVLDFGYGGIGSLQLWAVLGADVTGVDVDPLLPVLYSEPGDLKPAPSGGQIKLVTGQWPADAAIRSDVDGGYDVILSKNTLKRGYIHPEREADPARLVHLGCEDEVFVAAVFEALKPGGFFLIYNISPAQAPPDKPYIPWADGRCPFGSDVLEKSGFEVLAYDKNDDAAVREMFLTLGYDNGGGRESLEKGLFAHYTLARKPK